MKVIDLRKTSNGSLKKLQQLFDRKSYPAHIEKGVRKILDEVREKGDLAVAKFAKKFDGVALKPADFKISEKEFATAEKLVSQELKNDILFAIDNIQDFAKEQIPKSWRKSPRPGVIVGEKFTPMERIAVYVPGGSAPLVSTAIHTAAIAKIASVKEIVAVTPPSKNGIHPAILFAMKSAGVTEAYRLGGVYAIGALAYGTKTIRKVEKIVGPGNAYVTAAKKIVYGEVGIDMAAGPSEIMIIADESAKPEFLAADMLSQAEHGSGYEQAVLICTDKKIADLTIQKIREFTKQKLKPSKGLKNVLASGVFVIIVRNLEQAVEIASTYAPEHLEIICEDPEKWVQKVRAAGAIFLGEWTPEAVGDYVAGPSHVLPTGSSARFFSGLSAEQFFRRSSIIRYDSDALKRESQSIIRIAETEGLTAHKLSVEVRRKEL